jgi:microcin C transport system substrate-binding protein
MTDRRRGAIAAATRRGMALARALAFLAGVVVCIAPLVSTARAETVIKAHGISTFGDLKYPAGFAHYDYVNPDAPKGGRMTFLGTGASQTFDSLNAFILKGEAAQGLSLIYDSLLSSAPDEPDSAYGLIAESLEYPEDRSWVIFNMRPEARFADGQPITAEDVVFTYEVLLEKGAPSYKIVLKDIEKVEALDPHKVKFTFRAAASTRDLPALAGGLSILPKHYYQTVPFEDSTMVPPVGSGQYVVKSADPGRSIEYCRNPDYWGKDLPVNIGTANFECYVYEYFADRTAAFEAFKAGGYLFHQEFVSLNWATGYDFPALTKGWVRKEELDDNTPSGTQGFWFNLRREKFADPRVREAIGLMFNFEWTNETLFYGLYKRTDSFFENSPMQAEGVPAGDELAVLEPFRDQLPPEVFTEPAVVPPTSGKTQLDRGNMRRASALLDEAGWTAGADGLRRNAKGETLSVELIDDSQSIARVINPFVSNLQKLGVAATFNLVDAAQMQQRQEDFEYDLMPGRFSMSFSPSIELRQMFSAESATVAGSANFSGVADPVVDALIEKVIQSKTREELDVRARALDRVLRAKRIWVPNWYSGKYLVAYWDVFGKPAKQPPFTRGDALWWADDEKLGLLKSQGALR